MPEKVVLDMDQFDGSGPTTQHRMRDADRKEIIKWFWRTCFSRRYASQPIKTIRDDVIEILKLKNGQPSALANIPISVTPRLFLDNSFRINSVLSKTFVLMLAQLSPRSFVSGVKTDLSAVLKEYNRNEFHHVYPRQFLKQTNKMRLMIHVLLISASCRGQITT